MPEQVVDMEDVGGLPPSSSHGTDSRGQVEPELLATAMDDAASSSTVKAEPTEPASGAEQVGGLSSVSVKGELGGGDVGGLPPSSTPLKAAMEADVGGPSLPSSSSSQGLPLKHKPKLCDPKLDDDDAEGTSASQSASSAAESLQKRFMRTDLGAQSDKVKRTVVEGDEDVPVLQVRWPAPCFWLG